MNYPGRISREALEMALSPEPKLSLTIIVPVKNEALNLPGCLQSLPPSVPVLVVDSGSADATLEIARGAGAETIVFDWDGAFPKKRNWVLQTYRFNTDWVLFLDADERLTPRFVERLGPALSRTDVSGYWLRYNNYFMGKCLRHGVPQRKLALFRVGAGYYERTGDEGWAALDIEVHEHPILQGSTSEITTPIEHHDQRSLHEFIARHNEYSTWEARRYLALLNDQEALHRLTFRQRVKYRLLESRWLAPLYFFYTFIIKAGFLDGKRGFVYATLKFEYFFHIRLKILEARS